MNQEERKGIRNNLNLSYTFALIAHSIMFLIFLRYKIDIMVYINVGSIVLYLILHFVSTRMKNYSYASLFVAISSLEVAIHQVAAILCVGSGIGFEYFLIIVGLSLVLQSKKVISSKIKIVISVGVIILIIAIQVYAFGRQPLYELPQDVQQIFLAVITAVSVFGILAFALNQWNITEKYREQIEELLGERNIKILEMQEKTVHNFADLVESRDGNTGGHIKRTSAYVEAIIQALNEDGKYQDTLTHEYSQMIISAAPLHDIGKIAISDAILQKRGKLSDEEYEVMKTHSATGANMLQDLLGDMESEEYVKVATEVAKSHHEKWNGKGYPEHLEGNQIPLCARIMAVADVFDALTSVRAYKDKFSMDKAYEIMESEAGQQFDAEIISEFVRIRPHIEEIYNRLYED